MGNTNASPETYPIGQYGHSPYQSRPLSRGHRPPVDVTSLRQPLIRNCFTNYRKLFQNFSITYAKRRLTVTKVCCLRCFCSFLRCWTVLIEICPLVPFPPSVREGFSDYTRTALRWRPVTSARTGPEVGVGVVDSRLPPLTKPPNKPAQLATIAVHGRGWPLRTGRVPGFQREERSPLLTTQSAENSRRQRKSG